MCLLAEIFQGQAGCVEVVRSGQQLLTSFLELVQHVFVRAKIYVSHCHSSPLGKKTFTTCLHETTGFGYSY
jgi:hypothetical protein